MIFYDFEVFKYDWLGIFIDLETEKEYAIVNDLPLLESLYNEHESDIWVGFNNKHYDQYIFKSICLGIDPKAVNDFIIVDGCEGWQFSKAFNMIPMINYDVMPDQQNGLKTLEGFMGSDIRETTVPFNVDRKLTEDEIRQTLFYCRHDVMQTISIFDECADEFDAKLQTVSLFPHQLTLADIGETFARLTAKVLGCRRTSFDDEFDFYFLPCLRLKKYKFVMDWFSEQQRDIKRLLEALPKNSQARSKIVKDFYDRSMSVDVAGVPHRFGFGGIHGAPDKPLHAKGALYHVDVRNYYPSLVIAWNLVTRAATNDNYQGLYATRQQLKMKQESAATKEEAKKWKKAQTPYKKMLNSLSGAMKDRTSPAYDPRNNNCMCINGQLMLLDLIEHLEAIDGFALIQSNTDGLIVQIPDTDEAFNQMDDICWEWEQRCSTDLCEIRLTLDCISEIYQKDVNNYLWITADNGVERIGAYLKELSPIDNDLPILNKALVDFMTKKVPIEETINSCDDLIMFQKIVKLSDKYRFVEHEHCEPTVTKVGKRVIKTKFDYPKRIRYDNKSYRVFASRDRKDGRLLKCGGASGKPEKFGNTPDHCFIWNEAVKDVKIPPNLDKQWYIDMANRRLKSFGI